MATATKSIPFVVSAQPTPAVKREAISQTELQFFLALRARAVEIEKQIAEHEASFALRLESGAGIEPGVHSAELKESFRRNIAWKSVAVRLADRFGLGGEKYAKRVLAATKPNRTISLEVR
jgi:hypothetical protein